MNEYRPILAESPHNFHFLPHFNSISTELIFTISPSQPRGGAGSRSNRLETLSFSARSPQQPTGNAGRHVTSGIRACHEMPAAAAYCILLLVATRTSCSRMQIDQPAIYRPQSSTVYSQYGTAFILLKYFTDTLKCRQCRDISQDRWDSKSLFNSVLTQQYLCQKFVKSVDVH